ncbi:hypothetical protein [Synechococcus sp. CBW1004]|uniref:hypothetical protein n=1 Tax=Synechococcus sp. CBW1004 TaxID=1353136 RepID=UPI001E3B2449|nr:hypothetical protein [Synechococcus sp. CBW1004]
MPCERQCAPFQDLDLLSFHALQQGCPQEGLAEALDRALEALGRRPMRDGQPLAGREREVVLEKMVTVFRERTVPLMRRLGVLS